MNGEQEIYIPPIARDPFGEAPDAPDEDEIYAPSGGGPPGGMEIIDEPEFLDIPEVELAPQWEP